MDGVDPLVVHDDAVLFLTEWYRAALGELAPTEPVCQGVEVVDSEPEPGQEFPAGLIVIRGDGGDDTWFLTADRDFGISILLDGLKQDARRLAAIVHGLRTQIPSPGPANPVSAVVSSQVPVDVTERQPHHRLYFPLTLAVVARGL